MSLQENLDLYPPGAFGRTWTIYTDAAKTTTQNLTGWTARAQIRTAAFPEGQLLGELTATTAASAVTVTASGSLIASWLAGWRRHDGVWDLVLIAPNGDAYPPLVGGRVTLHPSITQP